MELTDGERLILVMLADLQEALKVRGEVDPGFIKRAVINKDGWAIAMEYSGLFMSGDLPPEVEETIDILAMFSHVESAIDNLDDPDRSRLQAHRNAKFAGFDGNNDSHYGHAHTLIRDMGRFSEFDGRALNSHSRGSLPRYQDMYQRYQPVLSRTSGELKVADLEEILG